MSKNHFWEFTPVDTLFFRDGKPFNAGEGGHAGAVSSFPPSMLTLQGAVRTALAFGTGWSPEKRDAWPRELGTYDHLGELNLEGPYVIYNRETLFPTPLCLLRKKEDNNTRLTRLLPGDKKVWCDLSDDQISLPMPSENIPGAKTLGNSWITAEGLEKILYGVLPDANDIYDENDLWHSEYRVGIERDNLRRTAADRKLYSCSHIRPNKNIKIMVKVSGVPESWHKRIPNLISLGGEGRMASVRVVTERPTIPKAPALQPSKGTLNFTVTLITRGRFENMSGVALNGPEEIPGQVISACIPKAIQIGGWDLARHRPRSLDSFLPGGSMWFYQTSDDNLPAVLALHGKCIGERTNYGFGQIVIGMWGDKR